MRQRIISLLEHFSSSNALAYLLTRVIGNLFLVEAAGLGEESLTFFLLSTDSDESLDAQSLASLRDGNGPFADVFVLLLAESGFLGGYDLSVLVLLEVLFGQSTLSFQFLTGKNLPSFALGGDFLGHFHFLHGGLHSLHRLHGGHFLHFHGHLVVANCPWF